ncbi:MAG: NAD(P)H-dependent oxidoreductase [Ezakiella sp.]|nr:NAD(P)H-dependent oxidoreductase [Ezakiella sp.]MDD7471482.1 NAD(P)H-dependent oxidoreductase [Bacillota bacterium]MDY3923684.1 NADPH-dependent FMN reductase [Ezakiella sp.]
MSKILYIVGSLTKNSINKKIAEELQKNAGGEIFTLENIPLFSEDLEKENVPAVAELREKVLEADRIVFVSPEYNYTFSGVMKNTIDWLSRPYGDNKPAIIGKKAAICGGSTSFFGPVRMRKDLFTLLSLLGMNVSSAELYVSADKITKEWDEATSKRIKKFAAAL